MGRPRKTNPMAAAIGAGGGAVLGGPVGALIGAGIGTWFGTDIPTLEDALRAFMSEHQLELVSVRSYRRNEISATYKAPDGSYGSVRVSVPSSDDDVDVDDALYDAAVAQLNQVSQRYAARTSA